MRSHAHGLAAMNSKISKNFPLTGQSLRTPPAEER